MIIRIAISAGFCLAAMVEANAQTQMGSFMIGGSASLQPHEITYSSPGFTTNSPAGTASINPTVGYFLINNLVAGVQLSYSRGWTLNDENVYSNSFGIGPLVRYYFPFGKFAVFPEAAISFQKANQGSYTSDSFSGSLLPIEYKTQQTTYRTGIGATWFVSPNVGIEGVLAYRYDKLEKGLATKQTFLYLNFGIQFYLPSKN